MHRAAAARWLDRTLRAADIAPSAGVPLCRCPAIGLTSRCSRKRLAVPAPVHWRSNHTEATVNDKERPPSLAEALKTPARRLPVTCSGCGAFAQTSDPQQLGYFDLQSSRVRNWTKPKRQARRPSETKENELVNEVLTTLDSSVLEELGLSPSAMMSEEKSQEAVIAEKPPVCDRCHNLKHHSTTSDTAKLTMYHPTVESLRETIEESPHKYNHIYHVIDAADFPMSLIPRLNVLLGDVTLRTRNRRSRLSTYHKDRKIDMSFIIARSDLLAPKREMVDAIMPYLREVLRDALGRLGDSVRLGNLMCVSAKMGWWTKDLREDIWRRGGAGWMVGKINVGKSQLFEAIYPKGRMMESKESNQGSVTSYLRDVVGAHSLRDGFVKEVEKASEDVDAGELLPPLQPAQQYPEMPIVSSLPGTTISPIRVPFGNGKGELIDLPGLSRSDLEIFVKENHRQSLITQKRIVPTQISVGPNMSLLLGGGLIRITPRSRGTTFLMYNFTRIGEHLTNTQKAIEFQEQTRDSLGIENIALPGVGDKMKHAGTFRLCHDVTKKRAGPLTRKNAVGLSVNQLAFRVLSIDILIEGLGYVEVVAQVRARDIERWSSMQHNADSSVPSDDPFTKLARARRDTMSGPACRPAPLPDECPVVDVYTPEGRFVGSRRPIEGWMNNKPRVLEKHRISRPRRSMRGKKKRAKQERRAREAAVETS